jgi:hypothetical protein
MAGNLVNGAMGSAFTGGLINFSYDDLNKASTVSDVILVSNIRRNGQIYPRATG